MKNKEYVRRGEKAHEETIGPSQRNFVKLLRKKYKKSIILQGAGIPDIIVIPKNTRIEFYEIKPKKGSLKHKYLNPCQNKFITKLLNDGLKNIFLVYYEKSKSGKIIYDKPIKLTKMNINKFSR